MTDETRGVEHCNACDQDDTDAMIHVAYGSWQKDAKTTITEPSFHHDCLPDEFRNDLASRTDSPQAIAALEIIAAADAGVRGDELLSVIAEADAKAVAATNAQEG